MGVVRWQVKNPQECLLVIPQCIVKKRVKAGENLLEVQWTSQDSALPSSVVACVPSTEFSLAYPEVYQGYLDMLAEKEAAKKRPKKKQEQENILINKPKNIVFTKLISSDPEFHNIVLNKKLLTPEVVSAQPSPDVPAPDYLDKSDSYVYKYPSPKISTGNHSTSMAVSDSMMQYMEDSDSDLSQIINDIVGVRNGDPMTKIMDDMANLQVSPATPTLSHIPKHMQTSTPFAGMSSSPLLKKVQQNIVQKKLQQPITKASDVF